MRSLFFNNRQTRAARIVAGLVLVAGIAGCTATEELKPAPTSRYIKTVPQPRAAPVPQPPKPVQQVVKRPRIYPEPEVLDGLTAEKVEALLGLPGFKRTDDPAEIWQYRVEDCILDLFMYETLDASQRSVAHYETRTKQGDTVNSKECFVRVLKAAETSARNL